MGKRYNKLKKRVKREMSKYYVRDHKYNTLPRAQELFSVAWNAYDYDIYDEWESIYLGTRDTTSDPNSNDNRPVAKARNVVNVAYEYIESQVNISKHQPVVKSKRRGFDFAAEMIQEKIADDLENLPIDEIVDLNERNTPVLGLSAVMLHWDMAQVHHDYIGDKRLINIHAKRIVPQPSIYKIDEMDYIFIVSSVSKRYIKDRYGVDVEYEQEQYPEVNYLDDVIRATETTLSTDPWDDKVTEIVMWYKDEDGDIGKYVYAGDTVLEDLEKYYYPRVSVCDKCEYENPQNVEVCDKCGHKKLTKTIKTKEVILEDMELSPIYYTVNKKVVMKDEGEEGKRRVGNVEEEVLIERKIKKGTEVNIFVPKKFPIAIRLNVPQNYRFRGRSDIESTRDQIEDIKKVMSRVSEKILTAPSIVTCDPKIKGQMTSAVLQVLSGNQKELDGIDIKSLTPNINGDLEFYQVQKTAMQDTLGITQSFQGKYDPSAKSGVAKEVAVQQAAGRLASKFNNKRKFFKDLFELMFWFDLAFTSEARPYMKKNVQGEVDYGEFNKYELLMKDDNGDWYYNTEFNITADNNDTLPKDKVFVYNQLLALYGAQAITLPQFLEGLDEIDFPLAGRWLSQLRMEMQEQKEMEEQQAEMQDAQGGMQGTTQQPPTDEEIIATLPPEQQQQFLALPPEQQQALLQELRGGV